MINFALTKCDFLTVLVCCSDQEIISCETRKQWIDRTFETHKNIEVRIFSYTENELPNTSVASYSVSKIWSDKFKILLPNHDFVITSEEYGNYVASYMNIKHIAFDAPKQLVPISATAIRKDLFINWNFLPNSVKPYFSIKVAILGTESTGKTTLAEQLTKYFTCSLVTEAGRDIIHNSNSFEFNDLYLVASEQAKRIEAAVLGKSPLVIMDTDIHITKSYARFMFQKNLDIESTLYHTNKADLYLYLDNNVPYIQDGTRLSKKQRNALDLSHREVLKAHNIEIITITGDWNQRFQKAINTIKQLLNTKKCW